MAKSKSFFGLRKGSTKTMTFSVLRGQQITKDRVTDIANPRTMDQTLQRIPFAQAVKFYKQATKGLFRFAFEDKKPLESDYNAFMRHNVKYASSVTKGNYSNPNYPALGNWLLSSGSLPSPELEVRDDTGIGLIVERAASEVTTIGGASELILGHYLDLAEGDIVTFVCFDTYLGANGVLFEEKLPTMLINQFVLDTTNTEGLQYISLADISSGDNALVFDRATGKGSAYAVIFSRMTPDGLKVSDSFVHGLEWYNDAMEAKTSSQTREGDAYSWGAAEKAILQGSLSD